MENRCKDESSFVRVFVEKETQNNLDEFSLKNIFIYIMNALSHFGTNNMEGHSINNETTKIREFTDDSSLFELGCFLFFQLDTWSFCYHSKQRQAVLKPLLTAFIKIFTEGFNKSNIHELYQNRVDNYLKISHKGKNDYFGDYEPYLVELLLRSKNNKYPDFCEFENLSYLSSVGITDKVNVSIFVGSWLHAWLPSIFDILDDYCKLTN